MTDDVCIVINFYTPCPRLPSLRSPFLSPEPYGCPSEAFAYGVERTHELFFPFGTGKEIELTVGKGQITAGERHVGKPHPTGDDSAEQRGTAFMKAQITAGLMTWVAILLTSLLAAIPTTGSTRQSSRICRRRRSATSAAPPKRRRVPVRSTNR
jgi:hypothetical protein